MRYVEEIRSSVLRKGKAGKAGDIINFIILGALKGHEIHLNCLALNVPILRRYVLIRRTTGLLSRPFVQYINFSA